MLLHDIVGLARSVFADDVVELRSEYLSRFPEGTIDALSEQVLLPFRELTAIEPLKIVSVEKVAGVVRRKIGRQVRFVPVSVEGMSGGVYGYVDYRRDEPYIVYNDGMNLCWTRFTIVKELMHFYSGTADDKWSEPGGGPSAAALVSAAMDSRWMKVSDDVDFDDETLALLLALEVLVPWPLRRQLQSLRSAGATEFQIAKAFMVPMNMIRFFFRADQRQLISYFSLSQEINRSFEERR